MRTTDAEYVTTRDTALLLDFYSQLLTERQTEILDMHYNEDYSISEIAENLGISRQAVHDALKSGLTALAAFEGKLGLVRLFNETLETRRAVSDAFADMRAGIVSLRADADKAKEAEGTKKVNGQETAREAAEANKAVEAIEELDAEKGGRKTVAEHADALDAAAGRLARLFERITGEQPYDAVTFAGED